MNVLSHTGKTFPIRFPLIGLFDLADLYNGAVAGGVIAEWCVTSEIARTPGEFLPLEEISKSKSEKRDVALEALDGLGNNRVMITTGAEMTLRVSEQLWRKKSNESDVSHLCCALSDSSETNFGSMDELIIHCIARMHRAVINGRGIRSSAYVFGMIDALKVVNMSIPHLDLSDAVMVLRALLGGLGQATLLCFNSQCGDDCDHNPSVEQSLYDHHLCKICSFDDMLGVGDMLGEAQGRLYDYARRRTQPQYACQTNKQPSIEGDSHTASSKRAQAMSLLCFRLECKEYVKIAARLLLTQNCGMVFVRDTQRPRPKSYSRHLLYCTS